jgi:hypothetical protein
LSRGWIAGWKQPFPAQRNLHVAPILDKIGAGGQNQMKVVIHHGIAADIDRENRCKLLEAKANPILSALSILPSSAVKKDDVCAALVCSCEEGGCLRSSPFVKMVGVCALLLCARLQA